MASATSCLVAPAREAPRACAAMQPSHWEPIDRVNAMSSLTLRGRAAVRHGARVQLPEARVDLRNGLAQVAGQGG